MQVTVSAPAELFTSNGNTPTLVDVEKVSEIVSDPLPVIAQVYHCCSPPAVLPLPTAVQVPIVAVPADFTGTPTVPVAPAAIMTNRVFPEVTLSGNVQVLVVELLAQPGSSGFPEVGCTIVAPLPPLLVTVIVAVEVLVVSAIDVAVSVTVAGLGTLLGPVYVTLVVVTLDRVPQVAPEQPAPERAHVTPWPLKSLLIVAVKACVASVLTDAVDGLTVAEIEAGGVPAVSRVVFWTAVLEVAPLVEKVTKVSRNRELDKLIAEASAVLPSP